MREIAELDIQKREENLVEVPYSISNVNYGCTRDIVQSQAD